MSSFTLTTCSIDETPVRTAAWPSRIWAALAASGRAFVAWRERREIRRRLYGMEPRLLRDMGFNPAEIYDQYHGQLDELPGDRFRGLNTISLWHTH